MDTPGERLRYLRQKAGLSQTQLAQRLGCTQQAIQRCETGQTNRPRYLYDAAKLFGVSYDWLSYGHENTDYKPSSIEPYSMKGVSELRQSSDKDLPIMSLSIGGREGRYILTGDMGEYIARPPQLEGVQKAYALYIQDQSMEPRFLKGEIVYIHPGKPSSIGDFVCLTLNQIKGNTEIEIGQLVEQENTYVCILKSGQNNKIKFKTSDIAKLDTIIMSAISQ